MAEAKQQELTAAQKKAVDAFVKANDELNEATDKLRANRADKLRRAHEAGVHGTTLAQASGLANSRIYQMLNEEG